MTRIKSQPLFQHVYPAGMALFLFGVGSMLFLHLPPWITGLSVLSGISLLLGRILFDAVSSLPSYAITSERIIYGFTVLLSTLVFAYLISPIIVIMPLSFNAESFFSYPMPGLSLQWYEDFLYGQNSRWLNALFVSLRLALVVTVLATLLGTLAALGLSRARLPFRGVVLGVLLLPMIVPVIITAVAQFIAFSQVGVVASFWALVVAHTALATPFVVITVTSTLTGFDWSLARAAASLGAPPVYAFRKVILPLIMPGVVSGALFAWVTSFDEAVVALFLASPENRTLPKQMFSGIRELISPTITAAATVLVLLSTLLLVGAELLRRRSERLRGVAPR
jgi:putative spermidine/putrescine transport system permease protein